MLIGIGESHEDRLQTLTDIAAIAKEYQHIQEVILQPYSPASDKMASTHYTSETTTNNCNRTNNNTTTTTSPFITTTPCLILPSHLSLPPVSPMEGLPVSIASLGLLYCKNDAVVGQGGSGLNLIDMALLPLTPIVGNGTAPLQVIDEYQH